MWCKWSCHEACPGTDNRNIFGLYLICFGSVYFCLESDLSELCPNLNESEGICGLLVFCKATVCRWIVSSEDIYFDNMSLISNTQCILILDWGKDRTFFFFFWKLSYTGDYSAALSTTVNTAVAGIPRHIALKHSPLNYLTLCPFRRLP